MRLSGHEVVEVCRGGCWYIPCRDRSPMKSHIFAVAFGLTTMALAGVAAADIAPACDAFADRVTCSKDDVGKPCSNGGTCYEVTCQDGSVPTSPPTAIQKFYKCETCPAVLDAGTCGATYNEPCAGD